MTTSQVPDRSLSGKVAVLTTDRRGWSRYLAGALAAAGADVAVAGSYGPELAEARAAIEAHGRASLPIETVLTRAAGVEETVERVVAELGRLDILVNNARVEMGKPFDDVTEAEWDAVMDFNVKSMFLCCQIAGTHMLRQGSGRIVNITSGLAVRGLANSAVYAASQGAVTQLTSSLALEWAPHNIRVNAIGAGWLTTDPRAATDSNDRVVRFLPSRRLGHPNDLGGLVVYLASDASDFVTGQTVYVDGGATAHA